MNKSKKETKMRFSNSKSNKSFHNRNKKPVSKWKEPSAGDESDLKLKKISNGVVDQKNQMKSKRKLPSEQVKSPSTVKYEKYAHSNRAIHRKDVPAKSVKSPVATSPKMSNNNQKRKAPNDNGLETKSKKQKKKSMPESDSDADDYIDRFFDDIYGEESSPSKPVDLEDVSLVESDEEDEDETTGDEEECEGEEKDGNAMSLEELIDFYGQRRDERVKEKATGKHRKTSKSSQCSSGWIEEDNDVELVYKDSDDETKSPSSRALVPVADIENVRYEEDDSEDYSSDDSGEEEVPIDLEAYLNGEDGSEENDADYSDEEEDDDMFGSDYTDSDSYEEASDEEDGSEEGSELDDHEFSSDYDSDDDDLGESDDYSDDGSDDAKDEYPSYWDESYDSEDDEDYIVEESYDDLYISRGTARVYNIDDNEVSFNSDVETAQIIELPVDDKRSKSIGTSGAESMEDDGTDGETGCPILVPIYDADGNLIDSPDKLNNVEKQKSSPSKSNNPVEAPSKILNIIPHLKEDLTQQNKMEEDVEQNGETHSSCRFYDSIDMRLSLLVLKETLFFSGHLTLQPLIGGLEVMGYNLSPGECRTVFAVRGFHSLNLTPRVQTGSNSTETLDKVMARVEKHFHEADLNEIRNSFDSSDSVLILLQADCNNKRVETVDKYLSEDFLFPKVEFLKKSPFFRTEYLLNVEFFTEHIDKSTSLYRSDPEWDKIILKSNSKVLVMGGKGSGKSTLCHYLINKNVQKFKKVVLIDLDIGQPIQHIPETISVTIVDRPLLGVATFNPIPPARSWLFGSLDVVSSLIFYTQNVRQLARYCEQHKSEFANIPWIINTMGYATDFGEELMAAVIRLLSPTDVIQLVSTNKQLAIPNFQNRFTSEYINQYIHNILRDEIKDYIQRKASYKHYELDVCYPKKGFTLNAPKRRNLMLLAHLADILQDSSSEWFNEVRPFCAPLNQLQVLITREDQTLSEDQLPAVLNATLVYLCRKDNTGLYECLGIGIVRGVDKTNNVYLLQSLPDNRLADVNVLAICSSSLPNAVFLRQSARIQGSIPYVYNID